jgi:ribosomal protein S1
MTRLRTRLPTLVVAVVAGTALVAAGCGGDDTGDYKKKVTAAAKQFQTDASKAGQSLSAAQSPTQFKSAAADFKTAVTTFTDKLDGLKAPSGVQDDQDKLVADLKHFQGTVDQISQNVSGGTTSDLNGLVALVPQLQTDVQKVSADAQKLQDAVNDS